MWEMIVSMPIEEISFRTMTLIQATDMESCQNADSCMMNMVIELTVIKSCTKLTERQISISA